MRDTEAQGVGGRPKLWSDQDSDSSTASDGVCSWPELHPVRSPAGQPGQKCPCPSPRCPEALAHTEVSEGRTVQIPARAGHREDVAHATVSLVPVLRGLRSSPPVLRSSVCSQGCLPSSEGCRVHSYQQTAAGHCVPYAHSPRGVNQRQNDVAGTVNSVSADLGSSVELDIIDRAPTPPQSLWLGWQQSKPCGRPNAVTSRAFICSQRRAADHVLGGSELVCGSSACDRTAAFSQWVAFPSQQFESCVSARKRSLRDHHQVIVNLGGTEDSDCERSKEQGGACSHSCPACPCLRCQQGRLTSRTRNVTKHQSQGVSSLTGSNRIAYCQSETQASSDSSPGSCTRKKSDWTRMVRMRYVGRCLLVLLLIGFGGLLAHVTVTDVSSGGSDAGVDGALGAGVVLGGGYHVDLLLNIRMRPVPVKEFQARLRTVRNKFDLLRIFLTDRDISDESLVRLLTASMLSSPSHALVLADVNKVAVASSMDDVEAEFSPVSNSDSLHIQVAAGSDKRQDSHLLRREGGLSKPPKSDAQYVTRKDNDSADSGVVKEKSRKSEDQTDQPSLLGKEKSRRDLSKSIAQSSKKIIQNGALRKDGSTMNSKTIVRSTETTVAYDASENEPVNADSEEVSVHLDSQVEEDLFESGPLSDDEKLLSSNLMRPAVSSALPENTSPSAELVSDFRDETLLSPSSEKISVDKSDIKAVQQPSIFKVSDVRGDVREEATRPSSDVRSDVGEHASPYRSDVRKEASQSSSNVRVGLREQTSPPAFSDGKSEKDAPNRASSLQAPDTDNDAVANTPPPSRSKAADDLRQDRMMFGDDSHLAEVYKRAKPWAGDDDYVEDKVIRKADYMDGETDYLNDAAHTDAILEELEAAAHHISEMENNPHTLCRDPQPQVVYIEDPKKQNRQLYPECTVIYRCRNDSGCCGRNYECGPKYEQVIFRTFLVMTVNETAHTVLPDAQIVERIALVNHTECQCREKRRLPDCTQSCPGVFRMHRYGSRCVCDCVSSANERFPQCDDVKEGLQPLSQEDLVCIKSGKCRVPRCTSGKFDVSTGFCPFSDMYTGPSPVLKERKRQEQQQRQRQEQQKQQRQEQQLRRRQEQQQRQRQPQRQRQQQRRHQRSHFEMERERLPAYHSSKVPIEGSGDF